MCFWLIEYPYIQTGYLSNQNVLKVLYALYSATDQDNNLKDLIYCGDTSKSILHFNFELNGSLKLDTRAYLTRAVENIYSHYKHMKQVYKIVRNMVCSLHGKNVTKIFHIKCE